MYHMMHHHQHAAGPYPYYPGLMPMYVLGGSMRMVMHVRQPCAALAFPHLALSLCFMPACLPACSAPT